MKPLAEKIYVMQNFDHNRYKDYTTTVAACTAHVASMKAELLTMHNACKKLDSTPISDNDLNDCFDKMKIVQVVNTSCFGVLRVD